MARDRDVAAFGERAQRYDVGWLGRMHHQIADRTADLALTCVPAPRRILDVGCGTGYLLGRLAARAPQAEALAGIDAAPAMIGPIRIMLRSRCEQQVVMSCALHELLLIELRTDRRRIRIIPIP